MAWTAYQLTIGIIMVVTGSINTLAAKWADTIPSKNSVGKVVQFDHPYLQACAMFLGEILCFVAFKTMTCDQKRLRRTRNGEETDPLIVNSDANEGEVGEESPDFNPIIFLPAALCDMLATSTMYVGLTMTYASSFQMLRGAVIVFTGLLSVAFLGRTLKWREWAGIGLVVIGLSLVGLSDFVSGSSNSKSFSTNNIITGDLLILVAQIITSCQMVYEERFITKYNVPPLQAVGWEGMFGFGVLSVLLVPMYYIRVIPTFGHGPHNQLEDAIDGFIQIKNNHLLIVALTGTVISIAFFNFAGVSVTKEISATTRMVLDSVRTIVIWTVSLAIRWQTFYYLQLIGFVVLISGMCVYNDLIITPLLRRLGCCFSGDLTAPVRDSAEREPINNGRQLGQPSEEIYS